MLGRDSVPGRHIAPIGGLVNHRMGDPWPTFGVMRSGVTVLVSLNTDNDPFGRAESVCN